MCCNVSCSMKPRCAGADPPGSSLAGNPVSPRLPAAPACTTCWAASALLAANLKFDGTLVMQMQGSAALKLAVVEINADHPARHRPLGWRAGRRRQRGAAGPGRFVITLDPRNGSQPYQGIVAGRATTSPPCWSTICCARTAGHPAAAGLQRRQRRQHAAATPAGRPRRQRRLAARVRTLAETVSAEELLTLPADFLLYRLFHQESVQCFRAGQPELCLHLQPRAGGRHVADDGRGSRQRDSKSKAAWKCSVILQPALCVRRRRRRRFVY